MLRPRITAQGHRTPILGALAKRLDQLENATSVVESARRGPTVQYLKKLGTGSEAYAPLARAVAGGMTVSLLFTVFLVPAAYLAFYRWRERRTAAGTAHVVRFGCVVASKRHQAGSKRQARAARTARRRLNSSMLAIGVGSTPRRIAR